MCKDRVYVVSNDYFSSRRERICRTDRDGSVVITLSWLLIFGNRGDDASFPLTWTVEVKSDRLNRGINGWCRLAEKPVRQPVFSLKAQ